MTLRLPKWAPDIEFAFSIPGFRVWTWVLREAYERRWFEIFTLRFEILWKFSFSLSIYKKEM